MFNRLLALAVLTCAVTTSAQTVTYVRPSKGKTLTVFDNIPLNPAIQFNPLVSAVFDWTAFTAVQIRVDVSKGGSAVNPLTQCGYQPIVTVLGATEPGALTYIQATDPSAQTFIDTTGYTYTVGNLSPYIKFTLGSELAFGPALPDCTARVTVVPFPVDQNFRTVGGLYKLNEAVKMATLNPAISGGLADQPKLLPFEPPPTDLVPTYNYYINANGYAVNAPTLLTSGGATLAPVDMFLAAPVVVTNAVAVEVFNSHTTQSFYPTNVTIENVGTVAVRCSLVKRAPADPATVTAVKYSFILKGASVAGDGTGGSKTFTGMVGYYNSVQCITAAGATSIAVQPF